MSCKSIHLDASSSHRVYVMVIPQLATHFPRPRPLCTVFSGTDFSSSILNSASFHLQVHLLAYLSTNSLRILYCVLNPGLQQLLRARGCAAGTHGIPVEPVIGTASFCPSYSKASTRQVTVSMTEHFSLFSTIKNTV